MAAEISGIGHRGAKVVFVRRVEVRVDPAGSGQGKVGVLKEIGVEKAGVVIAGTGAGDAGRNTAADLPGRP